MATPPPPHSYVSSTGGGSGFPAPFQQAHSQGYLLPQHHAPSSAPSHVHSASTPPQSIGEADLQAYMVKQHYAAAIYQQQQQQQQQPVTPSAAGGGGGAFPNPFAQPQQPYYQGVRCVFVFVFVCVNACVRVFDFRALCANGKNE